MNESITALFMTILFIIKLLKKYTQLHIELPCYALDICMNSYSNDKKNVFVTLN